MEHARLSSRISPILRDRLSFTQDGEFARSRENLFMVETILLSGAALIGLPHLLAPIALRRAYRFSGVQRPRSLSPEECPAEMGEGIRMLTPSLQNLGFASLGLYEFAEPEAHTRTILALFFNPGTNDFANFTVFITGRVVHSYLEFSTEFSSRFRIETNNNGVLPLTPDPATVRVFRFAEIRETFALYRLHRLLIEKHAAGRWAEPEPKGQELLRWTRAVENFGPRHVAIGYMQPAGDGGQFRLTWKGAALMAWRALWPASLIRRALYKQAMRAELHSLEVRGVTTLQKA